MVKHLKQYDPAAERANCSYYIRIPYVSINQNRNLLYNLQRTGHYIAGSGYQIDRVLPDTYLILMTISGEGELNYEGKRIRLLPNSIFMIDCQVHHEYHTVGQKWEFKYMHFIGNNCQSFYEALNRRSPVIELSAASAQKINNNFSMICRLLENVTVYTDFELANRIFFILTLLVSENMKIESRCDTSDRRIVDRAMEYMRNHYSEQITVEEIADKMFMSRPHFSVVFKRLCGYSPHEYLTILRIEEAKRLLTEADMSVSEIAERTGFLSSSAFAHVFLKKVGVSPMKYRHWF